MVTLPWCSRHQCRQVGRTFRPDSSHPQIFLPRPSLQAIHSLPWPQGRTLVSTAAAQHQPPAHSPRPLDNAHHGCCHRMWPRVHSKSCPHTIDAAARARGVHRQQHRNHRTEIRPLLIVPRRGAATPVASHGTPSRTVAGVAPKPRSRHGRGATASQMPPRKEGLHIESLMDTEGLHLESLTVATCRG
jgi:hypothetical protein